MTDYIRNFPPFGGYPKAPVQTRLGMGAPGGGSFLPAHCGWGVIFGESIPTDIRGEFKRLAKHRLRDSGYTDDDFTFLLNLPTPEKGVLARDYLAQLPISCQLGAPVAFPPKPERPLEDGYFPYYVLIVASPDEISFKFQIELGISCAVGRIWLESDVGPYKRYVDRELNFPTNLPAPRTRVAVGFAMPKTGDARLRYFQKNLVEPLRMTQGKGSPPKLTVWEEERDLMEANDPVLFHLAHGYEPRSDEIPNRLGALAGNPVDGVPSSLDSIPDQEKSWGCVWAFSCYSAGASSSLAETTLNTAPPGESSSALIHNLLRLSRCGLGSVNRLSMLSFLNPAGKTYISHLSSALQSVRDGYPVGWVREQTFSGLWTNSLRELEIARKANMNQEAEECWRWFNDLSQVVVIGDPAVQVTA